MTTNLKTTLEKILEVHNEAFVGYVHAGWPIKTVDNLNKETVATILQLLEDYCIEQRIDTLKQLDSWIDRNHYQPVLDESDRWTRASREIMDKIKQEIQTLQSSIKEREQK